MFEHRPSWGFFCRVFEGTLSLSWLQTLGFSCDSLVPQVAGLRKASRYEVSPPAFSPYQSRLFALWLTNRWLTRGQVAFHFLLVQTKLMGNTAGPVFLRSSHTACGCAVVLHGPAAGDVGGCVRALTSPVCVVGFRGSEYSRSNATTRPV